jgi:hypothetical protein
VPPKDWPGNRRRHGAPRGEHLGNQTHATHSGDVGANTSDSNSTNGDDEEDECDQEDEEDECDENAEEEDDEPAAGRGQAAEKPGAKDKEKEAQKRTEAEASRASESRIKALEDRVNSLEKENQAKKHEDRDQEHQDADNLVGQDKTTHPQDGEEEPQKVGESHRSGRRDSDSPAQGSREVGNQSGEEGEKTEAAEEARWNLEAFQKICGTDKMPMPQKTRERIRRDFHLFDADHNDMLDLTELKVFAPYASVMILCLYLHVPACPQTRQGNGKVNKWCVHHLMCACVHHLVSSGVDDLVI